MPLAEGAFRNLKCPSEEKLEVDVLLMRWPPQGEATWMVALPMRLAQDGIILAIPCGVIPPEILSEGETDPTQLVGPHLEVAVGVEGESDMDVQVQVALVEFKAEVKRLLEHRPNKTKKTVVGYGDNPAQMPDLAELVMTCREWIEGGHLRSDGYVTANPGDSGDGATDISKELRLMREMMEQRLEVLETGLVTLQSHPILHSKPVVRPGMPSGSLDGEKLGKEEERAILDSVRAQVKPAPVRVMDQPGARKDTLVPAPALSGLVEPPENLSLDQLMKAQLIQMMQGKVGKKNKKDKKLPGLPSWEDSQSSDEEGGTWSSSSKGGRGIEAVERLQHAMVQHPRPYQDRVEQKMVKSVEMLKLDASTPGKYIRGVPVGKSRTAGYCLHGFAEVHRLMILGEMDQARLHTLRMMAALEQFLIDENWQVASRLTGLEEPPWSEWAVQDLGTLRRQYVYSRLVEPTWVGAHINQLKEEEWLIKKRSSMVQPAPKPKGGGKGKEGTETTSASSGAA